MSTTSYASWTGDDRVDALLHGAQWGPGSGSGVRLTYEFYDAPYPSSVRAEVADALALWAEVADVTLSRTSRDGDLRYYHLSRTEGFAAYPDHPTMAGAVYFGDSIIGPGVDRSPGSWAHYVMVHEPGHALGLKHPFQSLPDNTTRLSGEEATQKYSIMNYEMWQGLRAQTPMLYDILAMQHLYGANEATRSGDTTYRWDWDDAPLMTIWDGGGEDTLDFSNQRRPVTIDLREGGFSSAGINLNASDGAPSRPTENIAIAFGVTVENAVGSAHDDVIVGNAAANDLRGGGGDDTLTGGGGDDFIDGGAGVDTAVFADVAARYVATVDAQGLVLDGPDGRDRLVDVERFRFTDTTLDRSDLVAADDRTAANTPPVATADRVSGREDTSLVIDVCANDVDPDGDTLTIVGTTRPQHGTLSLTADGTLLYRPDAEFAGADGFVYSVSDGTATVWGEVAIAVAAVNDAPTTVNDSFEIEAGTTGLLQPLANDRDVDGDGIALIEVDRSSLGSARLESDGTISFTAASAGTEWLRYVVVDDAGARADGWIHLTVEPEQGALNVVSGSGGRDYLRGSDGADHLLGAGGRDVLYAYDGDDRLEGGSGDDRLYGYDGADTLEGGAGKDRLYGHDGDDRLEGGSGDDYLRGDRGDDVLDGGAGDDTLYGRGGADRFVFTGEHGWDDIRDFDPGIDVVVFAGAVGGLGTGADLDSNGDGCLSDADAAVTLDGRSLEVDTGGGNGIELRYVDMLDIGDWLVA